MWLLIDEVLPGLQHDSRGRRSRQQQQRIPAAATKRLWQTYTWACNVHRAGLPHKQETGLLNNRAMKETSPASSRTLGRLLQRPV